MNKKDLEALEEAAMPLITWMRENQCTPMDIVEVTRTSVQMTEVVVSIPGIGE